MAATKTELLDAARLEASRGGNAFLRRATESRTFRWFILACIIVNAITLGIDAHFGENNPWHRLIEDLDVIFLGIFTAEIILEFLAQGPRAYFKDGWNWFDMIVVGISYLSMSAFSALRTMRVLRVLRLVSNVPQMRRVVEALIGAMPGILATTMILAVVFYIASVMATMMFGQTHEQFGDLGASALTLFQLSQFDGWGDTIRDLNKTYPWAWAFFLGFTVLAAFAVLNLFIGVIVDAVQETRDEKLQRAVTSAIESEVGEIEQDVEGVARAQERSADVQLALLDEIRAMRAELNAMKGQGAPPSA